MDIRYVDCLKLSAYLRVSGITAAEIVSFSGAPDMYHVKLLQVPGGYCFYADFEIVTVRDYGEWNLRIKTDLSGSRKRHVLQAQNMPFIYPFIYIVLPVPCISTRSSVL